MANNLSETCLPSDCVTSSWSLNIKLRGLQAYTCAVRKMYRHHSTVVQKMYCAKEKYCSIFFASCSLKSHAEPMEQPYLRRHCKEDWEHLAATLSTGGNSVHSD